MCCPMISLVAKYNTQVVNVARLYQIVTRQNNQL